jgi:hypothetical protein
MARFWLLSALLAIATALTGWWTLAHFSDMWSPNDLWQLVLNKDNPDNNRRLAHTVTGGGIIVLLLILAGASRFPIGRRLVVSIFALILLAAVVAQIWFGSLLMFDSASGPLGKFNGAAESIIPESQPTSEPATPSIFEDPTTLPATAPASVPST